MLVELAYGTTGLTVELPESRTTVIEPEHVSGIAEPAVALREAMRGPVGKPALRQMVHTGQTVAIAVCDVTRPMPSAAVLPVLLGELRHVPREQIVVLVATGTHRPNTPQELTEMLGPEVVRDYRVVNHSAFDPEGLTLVGDTPDAIPVWLNRLWMESDFRITTGFVEPHFFAGFSGGPKMVAPGLAGFDTILGLHGAAMIGHPDATWGVTDGNPVHDAIRWIAGETGVDFSVDVTINRDRAITGVYTGELFEAHRAACVTAKRTAMRPVEAPFDIAITSNSGYPLDLNLYQSIKGMSAAAQIVRDGGTIICAAECRDGIPEHGEYRRILASRESPEALLELVCSPEYRRHDQWQVQMQAQVQRRARVLLRSSYLEPAQVRAAHLEPIEDISAVIPELVRQYGPDTRICVLPQGPQTIPYLDGSSV